MSLYLQIAVGAGRYLLDAAPILEIRSFAAAGPGPAGEGAGAPRVDLRALFAEPTVAPGFCVMLRQASGEIAALLVDRVDGLVDVGEGEFHPLPPIGPVGLGIDAVAAAAADRAPLLRLRGERALAAAGLG